MKVFGEEVDPNPDFVDRVLNAPTDDDDERPSRHEYLVKAVPSTQGDRGTIRLLEDWEKFAVYTRGGVKKSKTMTLPEAIEALERIQNGNRQ